MKRFTLLTVAVLCAALMNPLLLLAATPFSETAEVAQPQSGASPFDVKVTQTEVAIEADEDAVVQVTDTAPEPAAAPEPVAEYTSRAVQRGDSLWRIAQELLGDGRRYREIIEANKDKYPSLEKNPDLILTGWELKIPVDKPTPAPVPADETPAEPAPSVAVDADSGSPASEIPQLPALTVGERVEKLQAAIDSANRALNKTGQVLADFNDSSRKWMIANGFLTEEEWAALNPPAGHTYKLNRQGVVELVGDNNEPLTASQMADLDKAAIDAVEEYVQKQNKKIEQSREAAKAKEAEKAKKAKEDKKSEKTEEVKKSDKSEKADKDKKAEKPKKTQQKESEDTPKGKTDAEIEKTAQSQYERMLSQMGVPDFSSSARTYIKALDGGHKMMRTNMFTSSPFYKFQRTDLYPHLNIPLLQHQLKSAQKHYEKMVDKGRTSRVLGIFGSTIDSAGKKVRQLEESLQKAWTELEGVIKQASDKAAGLNKTIKDGQNSRTKLQKELDGLDRYNAANSAKVQQLQKQIADIDEDLEDAQKRISEYQKLQQAFNL